MIEAVNILRIFLLLGVTKSEQNCLISGKLDQQQKKEVEEAIEKQEAISEYLFDQEVIPGLDDLDMMRDGSGISESDGIHGTEDKQMSSAYSEEAFIKVIRKNIRRAFVKMGMAAAAVVLVVLLLVETLLPRVIDRFYYDPGKMIGKETSQLALDMAVFTELMIPQQFYRKEAVVERRGYGKYDIVLPQNFGFAGMNFHSIAGRIEKNRLTLYDVNSLNPINNYFGWCQAEDKTNESLTEIMEAEARQAEKDPDAGAVLRAFAGDRQQASETLQELSSGQLYAGYVSLDRIMDYETFMQLNEKEQLSAIW